MTGAPRPVIVPQLILAASTFLLVAFIYWPALVWLRYKWGGDEYYSHGPFLIPVSAYLIWQKRQSLARELKLAGPPSWRNAWPLLVTLLVFLVFTIADVQFLQSLTLPLLLLSIVYALKGKRVAQVVAFPALFLLLAVPLSGALVQTVTVPLQNIGAGLAASVLGLAGLPIERDGVNLLTPRYKFVVEVACSGLKGTIVLCTLATFLAYTLPRINFWARSTLVLLSIPIALLANALRIVFIVLLGYFFGLKVADGFLHEGSGLFLFVLSCLMLLGAAQRLEALGWVNATSPETLKSDDAPAVTPVVPLPVSGSTFSGRALTACVLGVLSVGALVRPLLQAPAQARGKQARTEAAPLPAMMSRWTGKHTPVPAQVFDILDPDSATQMLYTLKTPGAVASNPATTPQVAVMVIYSRKWKNFHSPVMCLRAMGWEISNETSTSVTSLLDGKPRTLNLQLLTAQKERGMTHIGYCFMDSSGDVKGWIPAMTKLANANLLRRKDGMAEVQFGFSPALLQPDGTVRPELAELIAGVSSRVQATLAHD